MRDPVHVYHSHVRCCAPDRGCWQLSGHAVHCWIPRNKADVPAHARASPERLQLSLRLTPCQNISAFLFVGGVAIECGILQSGLMVGRTHCDCRWARRSTEGGCGFRAETGFDGFTVGTVLTAGWALATGGRTTGLCGRDAGGGDGFPVYRTSWLCLMSRPWLCRQQTCSADVHLPTLLCSCRIFTSY
jgi:hypothetical protein